MSRSRPRQVYLRGPKNLGFWLHLVLRPRVVCAVPADEVIPSENLVNAKRLLASILCLVPPCMYVHAVLKLLKPCFSSDGSNTTREQRCPRRRVRRRGYTALEAAPRGSSVRRRSSRGRARVCPQRRALPIHRGRRVRHPAVSGRLSCGCLHLHESFSIMMCPCPRAPPPSVPNRKKRRSFDNACLVNLAAFTFFCSLPCLGSRRPGGETLVPGI